MGKQLSIREVFKNYNSSEQFSKEVIAALANERLYVPVVSVKVGSGEVDIPVRVPGEDGKECFAVFTSETVIDKRFYLKYKWREVSLIHLSSFLLEHTEERDVIVDPFSDQAFVLKFSLLTKLLASESLHEAQKTSVDALLDSDVSEYQEAIEVLRPFFEESTEIKGVYPFVYQDEQQSIHALALALDVAPGTKKSAYFSQLFKAINALTGNKTLMMLLDYDDLASEIRQMKIANLIQKKQ